MVASQDFRCQSQSHVDATTPLPAEAHACRLEALQAGMILDPLAVAPSLAGPALPQRECNSQCDLRSFGEGLSVSKLIGTTVSQRSRTKRSGPCAKIGRVADNDDETAQFVGGAFLQVGAAFLGLRRAACGRDLRHCLCFFSIDRRRPKITPARPAFSKRTERSCRAFTIRRIVKPLLGNIHARVARRYPDRMQHPASDGRFHSRGSRRHAARKRLLSDLVARTIDVSAPPG